MAESDKANSLSEDYLLKDTEGKLNVDSEPVEQAAEKDAVNATPEESATAAVSETVDSSRGSDAEENVTKTPPAATEESTENSDTDVTKTPPAATDETSENVEEGNTSDEPENKLETAPGDYRFPTTNQSRHCFTRYVEYHRCVAAKGEDASECDKFAKYYRSLCPGEWIDRWNEQRENGTFPGPL